MSAESPTIQKVLELSTNFQNTDWISTATNPSLGTLAFHEVVPVIASARTLLNSLDAQVLGLVPEDKRREIVDRLQNMTGVLNQLGSFNLQVQNAPQIHTNIIDTIRGNYNALVASLVIPLAVRTAVSLDLSNVLGQYTAEVNRSIIEVNDAVAEIKSKNDQASNALKAIQTVAAQSGVTRQSTWFEQEAREHRTAAIWWALGTAIFALLTVLWGVAALWLLPIDPKETLPVVVQQAIGKLIVFSGLTYALLWSARNYTANRHNVIVNRHRANSLQTFEAFVSAAEGDSETKSAVLLQATTSIFAAQPSGYSAKEPEVDQPSRFVEILRSTTPKP